MSIPALSYEKKISALKEARKIRQKRALIKKDLKAANIILRELLDKKSKHFELASKMKVFDLIRALPGFGDVKTINIMRELKISPRKRFCGLGKKQKSRFLDRISRL